MTIENAMDLTPHFIRTKQPCAEGFRWFLRHHQAGSNYQDLLDALVDAGRVNDACWLLAQFGPTNEVLSVDHISSTAIVFAGSLHVRGNIDVDSVVRVGWRIHAGGSISVGDALVSGDDIQCDGHIRSLGTLESGGRVKAAWGIESSGNMAVNADLHAAWDLRCGGHLSLGGLASVGRDLCVHGPIECAKSLLAGGSLVAANSVHAKGGISAGAEIDCGMHLESGWGIKAGGPIQARGAIRSGESVSTFETIRAGAGYGVFAGLSVQMDAWEFSARVCASEKPESLMSGWWAGARDV